MQLTTSPNLARAGSNVGGASRCPSIPSNTSTSLCLRFPSLRAVSDSRYFWSSTTNWGSPSHRPILPSQPIAFATAPTVCSRRCLPVIHSALLTMAYRRLSSNSSFSFTGVPSYNLFVDSASRSAFVIALFPVASKP